MKAVGLLLAGGQSRRLGQDKAQLRLPDGNSLLQRSAALLAQVAGSCWLAPGLREDLEMPEGFTLLQDLPEVLGPASPLLAFAKKIASFPEETNGVLVMALDQPCLERKHLELLLAQTESCLAQDESGRSGLPAWILAQDFAGLEASPEAQPRLMATLQSICLEQVALPQAACGLPATFNLNTPDDLRRFLEHCRAPGHDPPC